MIVVPTVVMIYCSYSVYKRLQSATVCLSSDRRIQARLKRNQSITRTLFGIILMFLVCHTGKVSWLHKILVEHFHQTGPLLCKKKVYGTFSTREFRPCANRLGPKPSSYKYIVQPQPTLSNCKLCFNTEPSTIIGLQFELGSGRLQ